MAETHDITLSINGRHYALTVDPRRTLADAIRDDCGLTGTHLGCEHGVCGACTIILDGAPVRACLMFAVQADGCTLRTVEGLAEGDSFHPLQHVYGAPRIAVWVLHAGLSDARGRVVGTQSRSRR